MLIYTDEVLNEIESIRDYAKIIKKKFKQGRPSEELLLDAEALEKRMEYLFSILPDGVSTGNTKRHISFMKKFLIENQPNRCKQDIKEIIKYDLPAISQRIRDWANGLQYIDADLRKEIATLIKTNQFDSAIRKAFVVFKSRLCKRFDIEESIDGYDLVNRVFGASSPFFPDMPKKQRQAYRDLFAGLFGLSRNRYAHNNVAATLSELDMVVSSINYCLKLIDDFHEVETDTLEHGI